MLKFFICTDTHTYAYDVAGPTDHKDQVTHNESCAIIDAAFEEMISRTDVDIILVSGDLTNSGHREEHKAFISRLRKLKAAGKRVYVITATHDYGSMKPDGEPLESGADRVDRRELRAMYEEFGFNEAIAEYKDLTYIVQLEPGIRLFCLNDDGDGGDRPGFYDEYLEWILKELKKAEDENQFVLAMCHHPTMPPSPVYKLIAPTNMIVDYENTDRTFADAGLRFMFTGHTHMHHINSITSEKGNTYYDINTGALVGVPAPYREVTVDGENLSIKTRRVKTFNWDMGGKTTEKYLADHFDRMLSDFFYFLAFDLDRFADLARGEFGLDQKIVEKFRFPLKLGGKFLYKLTLGKAGRLLFCKRKIDKSVRNVLVRDLFVEVVRNIYTGEQYYSVDTPIGAAAKEILSRLDKLLKPLVKKLPFESLFDFVYPLLYEGKPSQDAVLPILPTKK